MALSPDGRYVAFLAAPLGGSNLLWVRRLDRDSAPRALPGTDGAIQPFWSADSRFLAFGADEQLKKIDVDGGRPEVICPATRLFAGTWSRNGDVIFSPSQGTNLMHVSSAGGKPADITVLDRSRGERDHLWPQFLPDGRHFLYLARDEHRDGIIYVGSLDGSPPRRVAATQSSAVYAEPGWLLFRVNGQLAARRFNADTLAFEGEPMTAVANVLHNPGTFRTAFSVSDRGVLAYRSVLQTQLRWYDREGRVVGSLGETGSFLDPAVSPDGLRVAVARRDPESGTTDIVVHDLTTGKVSQITSHPESEDRAVWSADGTRVLFGTDGRGRNRVYSKPITAGSETALKGTEDATLLDASKDGKRLLISQGRAIVLVAIEDSGKTAKLIAEVARGNHFRLSPDGEWIAYAVNRSANESSLYDVYIRRVFHAPKLRSGSRTTAASSRAGGAMDTRFSMSRLTGG